MTRRLLLSLCLLLSACASVPLSTMMRMSSFGGEQFAALDPEQVQVRITLPPEYVLDADRSWLGIAITDKDRSYEGRFDLALVRQERGSLPGFYIGERPPAAVTTLRLAESAQPKFRELQAFVRKGRAEDVTIRVVPKLASRPQDAGEVQVWIDLFLNPGQGWFTLVDGASIELKKPVP